MSALLLVKRAQSIQWSVISNYKIKTQFNQTLEVHSVFDLRLHVLYQFNTYAFNGSIEDFIFLNVN
jgi:hypothetical protein